MVSMHLLSCQLHCENEVDLPECYIALTGDIKIACAKSTEPLAYSDACRQDYCGLTHDYFLCELHVYSSKSMFLKRGSDSLPNP